ncbi:hypothetical protein D3C73_947200 [compost metagenome]
MQGFLKGIDSPSGANGAGNRYHDTDAIGIAGPTEVEDLGLRRQRVGDHGHAAQLGLQMSGAPIDFHHPALDAINDNPVVHIIGFGGVEHDAGKHVTEGALQCETDNDGHHARGRQQALDR